MTDNDKKGNKLKGKKGIQDYSTHLLFYLVMPVTGSMIYEQGFGRWASGINILKDSAMLGHTSGL